MTRELYFVRVYVGLCGRRVVLIVEIYCYVVYELLRCSWYFIRYTVTLYNSPVDCILTATVRGSNGV